MAEGRRNSGRRPAARLTRVACSPALGQTADIDAVIPSRVETRAVFSSTQRLTNGMRAAVSPKIRLSAAAPLVVVIEIRVRPPVAHIMGGTCHALAAGKEGRRPGRATVGTPQVTAAVA